jgi:tetratricopeptide (TPR) repeat protein
MFRAALFVTISFIAWPAFADDPIGAAIYYKRGVDWHLKKEYDKAITDYSEALKLQPKLIPAYINRGIAWRDKEKYDKAIADFDEAIKLDPKIAAVYFHRGTAWGEKREYLKAITDYDRSIELNPKDLNAFINKAFCLTKLKKYGDVAKVYEAALKPDPDNLVLCRYAWFLSTCPEKKYRDGAVALKHARKAIELAGEDATWNHQDILAAAYAETGDFESAIAEEKKALAGKLGDDDRKAVEKRLALYKDNKPYRDE